MAMSLGSLFVDLKVNLAEFLTGMSKGEASMKAFGREIQTGLGEVGALFSGLGPMGQKLAGVLDAVGRSAKGAFEEIGRSQAMRVGLEALGGGVAALGGTLFALAEKASAVGSKIHDASIKTGIGAAQMSGLNAVCTETGGNFEGLTMSLARAGANLQSAIIDPGRKAGRIFTQLMGSSQALSDLGLKPMGDRIQVVLQHIFALNNVGERNMALSALLGRGWMENVGTLRFLAEQGYGPAIAQAKKFGEFFDTDSALQAKEFKVALTNLKAEIAGIGMAIGQKAIPFFTAWAVGVVGLGVELHALGLRMEAVSAAAGDQWPAAIALWKEAGEVAKSVDQAETDFAVHLQNVAAGEKGASDETEKLTGKHKTLRDALAEIISRERDELSALDSNNNARREMELEYNRSISAIQRAIDAGGTYKEGLEAQALALDVYNRKLDLFNEKILDTTKVKIPNMPWLGGPRTAPELATPAMPANLLTPGGRLPTETLSQLAELATRTDGVRFMFRALREESELSDASFKKLAAAFPGLTEGEVAATAAGRALIEQLTRLDKVGSLAEQFKELRNTLELEGSELGKHLIDTLGKAIEGIQDRLAQLVVTGRANFKQLYQSLEESVVKAGLQKVTGSIVSTLGLKIPGLDGKRDGSNAQSSLYVTAVDDSGSVLKSLFGGHGAGDTDEGPGYGPPMPGGGESDNGAMDDQTDLITGAFSSLFKSLESTLGAMLKGVGSALGSIGSFFGGFLAAGGDVTPGHAYIVGEKHPEWFVPKIAGQVLPQGGASSMRPLIYSPTWQISTPDADSFRRASSQIVSDGYRQMAIAHARNS
jgi:hypothetical protein